MGALDPILPDHPLDEWASQPHHERLRMQCATWVTQGAGTPVGIHVIYVIKALVFILGWALLVTRTGDVGGLADIADWWLTPGAFIKAVLWAMLFEGLGLGCGSGPLTGHYSPMFVAFKHFLRPGTARLAPWPNRNPFTGGHRRTPVDAALYGLIVLSIIRALVAETPGLAEIIPVVALVAVLGLRDKTAFLMFRSEHYWTTLLVLALALAMDDGQPNKQFVNWLAGAKAVQLAIWWGAAVSKLNHHFPSVVATMVSNAPLVPSAVRQRMFVDGPTDMRPSRLAATMAHGGTAIEFLFPLILVLSSGGTGTTIALAVMVVFHLVIMTSAALGVPTEWNVFFIYSMFVLFGEHADVSLFDQQNPAIIVVLLVGLVVVPVVGNLRPKSVSFLPAMRYYAGNWETSHWWFRTGALERLADSMTLASGTTRAQLQLFNDEVTTEYLLFKAITFRAMHLHGRLHTALAQRVADDLDAYEAIDGETVAGLVLGWNFGDGHLHDEQLLSIVQEHAVFEPGDLRVVMIDAQPIGKPIWRWRIVDAAAGEVARGEAAIPDFLDRQPWDGDASDELVGVGQANTEGVA